MRQHFENGKGLGLPLLRPKIVKDTWYIIKDVRVDGQKCDQLKNIKILEEVITVDQTIESLRKLIAGQLGIEIQLQSSRPITIATIKNELENFSQFLKIAEALQQIKSDLIKLTNIVDKESLLFLQKQLEVVNLKGNVLEIEKTFNELLQNVIEVSNPPHHVIETLKHSITTRDVGEYFASYEQIQHLNQYAIKLQRFNKINKQLKESLPKLWNELITVSDYRCWQERFEHFYKALDWAKLNSWFNDFLQNDADQVSKDLVNVEINIKSTITLLGAKKAWCASLSAMTEGQRQHLIAWSTAMRKAGKRTGKHFPKHLRDAQYHMNFCRDSIPAWILPLYRVFETFEMKPNLFDVAIIDEASQSGPDAVILKYLAKKLIVVGDDKQISPEHVGLDRNSVELLRKQYLFDFKIADMLDAETSFFDLANVLFGGRITLREHFRCMPEIIGFSNKISYPNTPLIPLRQYPPNRLEPIKVVHVANGYREGAGQKVLNQPEAKAIVAQIKKCVKDPQYNDKTMGVISLQNTGQAQLIDNLLTKAIGTEEIERRNLTCGDAYTFQGDERDIIFLSLVAAPGETAMRAINTDKDRRRFNVATSRAKDQLWLFHSPTVNDFKNKECLRYQLIAYCQNPTQEIIEANREKCESGFEIAVFDQITSRGYRVIPQLEVAGYRLDLVVEGQSGRIAVECDGDQWHGPDRYEYDMNRQRILERCGWKFWRVRGSKYYRDPETVLQSLWETLNYYKIEPIGHETDIKNDELTTEVNPKHMAPNTIETTFKQLENTVIDVYEYENKIKKTEMQSKLDGISSKKKDTVEQVEFFPVEEETNSQIQISLFEEPSRPTAPKTTKMNKTSNGKNLEMSLSLETYFNSHGFEVIDKRSKNGALWIVEEKGIKPVIEELKKKGIKFTYSKNGGRATKNRSAWFTSHQE